MNQNILQKAIAELKSDKPKIDYVLGMLETLFEMQDKTISPPVLVRIPPVAGGTQPITDDASILDAKARAAIEQVKAMSEASKE